jgi:hypothetical protein
MHPYRDVPAHRTRRRTVDPEGIVLYGMLAAIGAIPVVIAIVEKIPFGFDATVGLIMLVTGLIGMFVARGRSSR